MPETTTRTDQWTLILVCDPFPPEADATDATEGHGDQPPATWGHLAADLGDGKPLFLTFINVADYPAEIQHVCWRQDPDSDGLRRLRFPVRQAPAVVS